MHNDFIMTLIIVCLQWLLPYTDCVSSTCSAPLIRYMSHAPFSCVCVCVCVCVCSRATMWGFWFDYGMFWYDRCISLNKSMAISAAHAGTLHYEAVHPPLLQYQSIQFNSMCKAPNHNIHYLKALYIEGQDPKHDRETQQFPQWAALWRLWREKRGAIERGGERRERPGTVVHHQISALTNDNYGCQDVINDSSNIAYNSNNKN